jgi:PAS domain S-box-containing protein
MVWETVPVVLLLFVAGLLTALFAIVFTRTRAYTTTLVPLVIVMAAVTVWSWSAAAGLWSNNPVLIILAQVTETAALAIIPVAFMQFSLQYTGRMPRSGTISWGLLLILPTILAALLIVNAIVPVVLTSNPLPPDLASSDGSSPGLVFWTFFTYGSVLMLTGIAIILQHHQSTSGVFRGQLACLLIAVLPPLLTYAGFAFRIRPFDIINLAPVTGIISVVALTAGIEQFSLFDLVPVECGVVLRQIPTGIMLLDGKGRIVETNMAARQLLGIGDRDIMGFLIGAVLPPHEIPPAQQQKNRGERRHTLKRERDGMVQYIDFRCIPLTVMSGELHGYVILLADITDQHLMDKSLTMARKKINLLTGITRHDILNQLTIIVMHNELLKETTRDPTLAKSVDEQMKAAKTIHRQIAFTKDYEKLGENLPQWLDIRTLFFKHQEDLGHDYITYNVQVEGLEVFADPLLDYVFNNLLENTIRYGEKVTSVGLYYEHHPHELKIIYQDNGVGIKKEDKEKIFKRGAGKRSGFGLFFSREILSLTGITMTETGEPGNEARFEITVPAGMFRFRPGK